MVRIALVIAVLLEIGFLVGLKMWLRSMPDMFIYGFGAGGAFFLTLGAPVTVLERRGY